MTNGKKYYTTLTTLLLCIMVMLAALFSACSEEDVVSGKHGKNETAGKKLVLSNTINIPIEKVTTLNPIVSGDEDVYFMSKLLYRSLFQLNEHMAAEADIVDSYEYLSDGTLSLIIKDGIAWEDGRPLTSDDVKLTVDALISLPGNSDSVYLDVAKKIRYCRLEKDGSIRIAFVNNKDRTLENLTFPILPSHKYKKSADLLKDKAEFMPMGTGSYKIEEMEEGKYISMVGSSDYKGNMPINTLVFTYLRNKEDAINLFGTDEVNLALLKQVDRGTMVESDWTEVYSFLSNEAEVLVFNLKSEVLQDPDLRKAIAFSIDRDTILHYSYFQSGFINDNLFYPGYLGMSAEDLKKKKNVGLTDADLEEVTLMSGKGGNLKLIYNKENNSRKMTAELIKSDLESKGFKVVVEGLDRDEYFDSLAKGEFDLCISGYRFNQKYDLRPILYSGGELNYASFSNEEADRLLDKLYSGLSLEERKESYKAIDGIIQAEMPYFCLLYKTYGLAVTKGLMGNVNPSFDNIYRGIENWQIQYEEQ